MKKSNRAMETIEFIQLLNLTADFYGQPFVLQPWQTEIIGDVYGTLNERGLRQYQFAYLEIPKKNGKTTLIAALGLSHLVLDPPGGEIYCCAADIGQASLSYNAIVQMIEQDPDLEELLKITDSSKTITNTETGSFLKVLSAEAFTKHGLNPSVVIFDELHAQPDRELWDVMTFGSGAARQEPLYWVITTAGDDPDRKSIGWEKHDYAKKIKEKTIVDPIWYVRIYAAPEDADIFDEQVWYDSNPSLGITIDIEKVRQEAIGARNSPSTEKLFRYLRLNQWVSIKSTGWLPLSLWDATAGTWNISELLGKNCYLGLDLSSTTDLTAIALLFPPQPGIADWRCLFEVFVPEESMRERSKVDKVPYEDWVRDKLLIATPGDAVDYDIVKSRIEQLVRLYKIRYICADKWNSQMMTQQLKKSAGLKTIEIPQTIAGLSPAMKELERMFRDKSITHEKSLLVRWCFGNVVIYTDGNENIKPMKNKSRDRIDPIVALINAMAGAMRLEKKKSNYEEHGIRSV